MPFCFAKIFCVFYQGISSKWDQLNTALQRNGKTVPVGSATLIRTWVCFVRLGGEGFQHKTKTDFIFGWEILNPSPCYPRGKCPRNFKGTQLQAAWIPNIFISWSHLFATSPSESGTINWNSVLQNAKYCKCGNDFNTRVCKCHGTRRGRSLSLLLILNLQCHLLNQWVPKWTNSIPNKLIKVLRSQELQQWVPFTAQWHWLHAE